MKRVGSVLGVIALVTALVTSVPAMGLPYLFIRFIFRYSDVPISPVSWLVCSICFFVGIVCILAFLLLYISGRLGHEMSFRRFLPVWIAIGLHGSVFVAIVVSLIIRIVFQILFMEVGVF